MAASGRIARHNSVEAAAIQFGKQLFVSLLRHANSLPGFVVGRQKNPLSNTPAVISIASNTLSISASRRQKSHSHGTSFQTVLVLTKAHSERSHSHGASFSKEPQALFVLKQGPGKKKKRHQEHRQQHLLASPSKSG